MTAFEIKRVTFSYRRAETQALADVSLSQERGALLALMGKTGAGKSTLAMCLNATVPQFFKGSFSGEVVVNGQPVGDATPAKLAEHVGIVFQDFECLLVSTDVAREMAFAPENLGVPPDEIHARSRRRLELVGLSEAESKEPHTLSGGQKQRLAIASGLAMEPKLLVLDEPTTDIDPAGRTDIMRIVDDLVQQGVAVLLIVDEADLARSADRVAIMSEGKVATEGAADEVLTDIALLESHGIRPPQIGELLARLGARPGVHTPSDAEAAIRGLGRFFSQEAYAGLAAQDRRPDADAPVAVQVNELSHAYETGVESLTDVSLDIRRGEFVAAIGQNGSGKTTLVKHLVGLIQPPAGRVRVNGEDVSERNASQLSATVGLVFQNPDHQIFSETVADEVAFGPRNLRLPEDEVSGTVSRVLDVVGLTGKEQADPFALTKGERQRLAVASTLAMDPQIIILDEPTTGLDYEDQRSMMGLLRDLNEQGRTIIIVTHSMWVVAEYAHRAVVMANGRILTDGPVREVFANTNVLERASLAPPEITQLGLRLGGATLTADELLTCLEAKD